MAGPGNDDIDVINNALAVFGGGEVGALDEESDLAEQCVRAYRPLMNFLIGRYEWSFATRTYRLNPIPRDTANGYDSTERAFQNGWPFAFHLPGERLGLPHRVLTNPLTPERPLRQYLIEEGRIFARSEKLWAAVPVWTAIENWSPAFRLLAETALASALCVGITHDKGLADILHERAFGPPSAGGAGGLMGTAISAEAGKTRGAAPMQSDPLGDARLQ